MLLFELTWTDLNEQYLKTRVPTRTVYLCGYNNDVTRLGWKFRKLS